MAIAKKILGKAVKETRLKFGNPKVEKPIKITKKEAKANARGLKAANKPVSKFNSKIYQEDITSEKMTISRKKNILKNTPPARPNRIRGGSMNSKLNWSESMTNTPKKINTELPKKNKFAKRSALHNEFKSNVDTTGMTSAQKRYAKNKYFIEKMNKGR